MVLEPGAESAAEDAHAGSVDDANAGQAGEVGAVEEFFDFVLGLVGGAADDVDLTAHDIRLGNGNSDAGTAMGGLDGRLRRAGGGDDFCDLVAGDAHLHGTDSDFKGAVVDLTLNDGDFAEGAQSDLIALSDVADDVRLGVLVAAVGSGVLGDDGGVEAFREFAAEAGDALLRLAGELLLSGAVLDGADGFAGLKFKVFDEGLELCFEVANFGAPLLHAFGVEPGALAGQLLFEAADAEALGVEGFELLVETVEEAGDVLGLGVQTLAGGGDDGGIEADALGDVDAGGGSGNTEAELVGGRESLLVETDGGVDGSGSVFSVDLEGGEVGGDDGPGSAAEEMLGDGDSEGGAFLGIGGGAQLVEENERTRGGLSGDAVEIADVGGEGGEILLDGLRVADVGEEGVEEGDDGFVGGDGNSGLGEDGEEAGGLEGDGFAAGVGAADDELAVRAGELQGDGNDLARLGAKTAVEERMAGVFEAELRGGVVADARRRAFVFLGEAGAGEEGIDFGEDGGPAENGGGELGELPGHVQEDAVNLGLFFFEEADEVVVELDGFEGLDVDGLTGGAGSVDDALDAAFPLGFDGDDEALAADGDEVVLGAAAFGKAAQSGAKAFLNGALLALHFAADAAEFRGGVVGEGAVGEDLFAQRYGEGTQLDGEEILGKGGELGDAVTGGFGRGADEVGPRGDFFGERDEGTNLFGFEGDAFDAGFGEEIGGIEEGTGDGNLSAGATEGVAGEEAHFSDESVLARDPGAVGGRGEGRDPGGAEGGLRIGTKEGDKSIPLEGGARCKRRRNGRKKRHKDIIGPGAGGRAAAAENRILETQGSGWIRGVGVKSSYLWRVCAAGAMGLMTACGSGGMSSAQGGSSTASAEKVPTSHHVVLVMEENQSYSTVAGNTKDWPNYNALIAKGALPTNYYANIHGSIADYFLLTTGEVLTDNDGLTKVWNVDNIARRMIAAGVSFRVYAEGITQGYLGGNTGLYVIRHEPFAMLSDVADNPKEAQAVIWPFTQFATDVAKGNLPEFSFIVPNIDDDAHSGTPQQADTWLEANVVKPLASYPAFQTGGDGVLIVDFDEGALSDNTNGGGHVAPVLWGPLVKAGYRQTSTTFYQHQSMLRTIMELLGLPNPMGQAANAPDMGEFFVQPKAASPPQG